MKFLVDAQLPKPLSDFLQTLGHDSVHTLELPDGNRTSDDEIIRISVEQERVLVSKDTDFVDSLLLKGEPYKLLSIATGNISNADLIDLFRLNIAQVAGLFDESEHVELTADSVIDHG